MPITVDVAATVAGIQAYEAKVAVEAAVAVHEGAQKIKTEAEALLQRQSHPRGTPTPSAPGTPPAMVDGHLSRSITPGGIVATPGGASEEVGPAGVPYARVQELGGVVGHGSVLPARPYLKPAVDRVRPEILAAFIAAWRF